MTVPTELFKDIRDLLNNAELQVTNALLNTLEESTILTLLDNTDVEEEIAFPKH